MKKHPVETESLELAEIPISFSEKVEYKKLNDEKSSIAFCDIEKMENSKPTAPVYVNKYPEDARWLSLDKDRLVFGKSILIDI